MFESLLSSTALFLIVVVVVFLLIGMIYSKNYIKVPPNQVAVFTGRGKQKIVRGGARFRVPVIERVDIMELEPFNVTVQVADIIAVDGVPVNVDGVGLIKFGSTDEAIATAVERFLTSDRQGLQRQVQEILAGNMRGIVSQMTIEELNNNREEFRRRVLEEAGSDFQKIGMELDVLTIQNISDSNGYLHSLGRKRIAEVQRDAEVGEANAQRDAKIAAAEAKRQGDTAQAEADAAIALAEQERDLTLARVRAEVDAQNATAAQAGPQAEAEARKAVVVAEAQVQMASEEAQIGVEQKRAERATEAQRADVIIPAEAQRQALVLTAEGESSAAVARAEAEAQGTRLQGDAAAEARKAAAVAHQAELEAEAEGDRAKLLAQAEGQEKMATALGAFTDEAARLSVLPDLIATLPGIVREAAAPFAQISSMVVMDGGSNGGEGASSRVANMVPEILKSALPILQAFGIDPAKLFGTDTAVETTGSDATSSSAEAAPAAVDG
ncbi:flotillin family protein [Candidatus Saccharibacteria bacterium]|nr:flotillin family protein [Candidatus Saccharibacteria bacterium]